MRTDIIIPTNGIEMYEFAIKHWYTCALIILGKRIEVSYE